jgi:hypothetical protein
MNPLLRPGIKSQFRYTVPGNSMHERVIIEAAKFCERLHRQRGADAH